MVALRCAADDLGEPGPRDCCLGGLPWAPPGGDVLEPSPADPRDNAEQVDASENRLVELLAVGRDEEAVDVQLKSDSGS